MIMMYACVYHAATTLRIATWHIQMIAAVLTVVLLHTEAVIFRLQLQCLISLLYDVLDTIWQTHCELVCIIL